MARDEFQLAAERAEAAHSSAEWASIGPSGRTAAIYRELRAIDTQTAERQWKTVETARRLVREGEERVARQDGLLTGIETVQGKESPQGRKSLEMIRGSLTLAKYRKRCSTALLQ